MMKNKDKELDQLELIHVLQRLGLAYHFVEEISKILKMISNCTNNNWDGNDLHETSLKFRLLRQNGYHVPQDVFKRFLNINGRFDDCIREDAKAILSLYEASYYYVDNEGILDETWVFTSNHLKNVNKTSKDQNVFHDLGSHALDIPLHWRMTRLEARWYIDVYEKESGMNPVILELAKLDFNIVQALHQQELRDLARCYMRPSKDIFL